MDPLDRQPPRFVPTLTDVVPESLPISKPAVNGVVASPPQVSRDADAALLQTSRAVEVEAVPKPESSELVHSLSMPLKPQPSDKASEERDLKMLKAALAEEIMVKVKPLIEAQLRATVEVIVRRNAEMLYAQTAAAVQDALQDVMDEVLQSSISATVLKQEPQD